MAWMGGNYPAAFETVKPYADMGQPWAQLRIATFYENGWGVTSDIKKLLNGTKRQRLKRQKVIGLKGR